MLSVINYYLNINDYTTTTTVINTSWLNYYRVATEKPKGPKKS